jgi:nucleoside-diphosphate-sugar epimerase
MAHSRNFPESVFIFGCGYVGGALARSLLAEGVRVGALTRNTGKAMELRALQRRGSTCGDRRSLAEVVEGELDSSAWHNQIKDSYAAVVNCVSSAGGGLAGYRKSYLEGQRSILKWAKTQAIQSYVHTGSTSVYPQDGGATVDESADTAEAPPTGRVLLESEALLAAAGLPNWYVLRLAGIYGPGRHYLLDQLRDGAGEIPGRGDYALNMIHRDDIVAAIRSALAGRAPSGIYNVADDAPATKAEVLAWLADQLGLPAPSFNPDEVSERLKRRGGRMPHRLVSNAKARAELDWRPRYPNYRKGYAALL